MNSLQTFRWNSALSHKQCLEDILLAIKIDVRIVEEVYKEKTFTSRAFCEENGIGLYFNKRSHRFLITGLRKEVINNI